MVEKYEGILVGGDVGLAVDDTVGLDDGQRVGYLLGLAGLAERTGAYTRV